MSEFLELTAPVTIGSEQEYEYFPPTEYRKPESGTPIVVSLFEITDGVPKEAMDPLFGKAVRCVYGGDTDTLGIQLEGDDLESANEHMPEYLKIYGTSIKAVQPGVHQVRLGNELARFVVTVDVVTSRSDILKDQS
jgi:hypothetical protein